MSAPRHDRIPEWQPEMEQARKMAQNMGWRITPDQFKDLRSKYELAENEYRDVIPANEKLTNSGRHFYVGMYALLADVARYQVETEDDVGGGVIKELLMERIRRYASDPAYRKQLQADYTSLREILKEDKVYREQGYGIQ